MGRWIALVLALVTGLAIAWAAERTPRPAPADAPATAFSAARAMGDVRAMAQEPHTTGTPANARVRDHLIRRMAELGLSPQVRPGVGVQQPEGQDVIIGGQIENLVGVLPGRDRNAPALALMAHYDSAPGSPGAADDAAGTSAALEIVRAIKARGAPARDVMVLITDGEEAGLLGANAFFRRDPLAKRIGLVLNMETRGGGGRVQMFQTSPDNGELIGLLSRTAQRPSSSSLTVFVYEQMPNDTDLTETLRAGVPGMNYAFVGRQFDYHAASSTPENLEQGALQDLGQQVLAVAEAAAFAPTLPAKAPSVVYSQVFADFVVAYPPWAGWLLLALAGALIVLAVRRARRLETFPWTDLLRGAGALLFAALTVAAVLQFARLATGAEAGFAEQRFLLAQVTRWEIALILIGLGVLFMAAAELARGRRIVVIVPLLAALGCAALGGFDPLAAGAGGIAFAVGYFAFGKPVPRPAAWGGVLLAGLVLAIAAQALAPYAAQVFAWPLLLAAIAAAATACAAKRGPASLALLALVAAVSVGWLGNLAHGAFLSMDFMPLLALPALLAALSLWPLAQCADGAPPERATGAVLLLAGLAVTAWVRFADPYDTRYPQAASVLYHLDHDAGRAFLVSSTPDLPVWSEAALKASGPISERRHWFWREPNPSAPAQRLEVPAPNVTLARRPDGLVSLVAQAPPGALALTLRLNADAPAALVSLNGAPLAGRLTPTEPVSLRWVGSNRVELVLRPAGPGRLQARAAALLPGWPAGAQPLPPMPADVMPWNVGGSTLVSRTHSLAW